MGGLAPGQDGEEEGRRAQKGVIFILTEILHRVQGRKWRPRGRQKGFWGTHLH